jgi:hypothetical protein
MTRGELLTVSNYEIEEDIETLQKSHQTSALD